MNNEIVFFSNSVPMKNDIVDLDAFEEIVKEEKKKREFFIDEQKMFWGMFYTTPTFHNPTGLTLPPGKMSFAFILN